MTKKTITFTVLMASIVMLATAGTTQVVQAQIFSSDDHTTEIVLVILAEDGSGSISTVDPDNDANTCNDLTDCSEWDLQRKGEQAALQAFYNDVAQHGFTRDITWAIVEFGTDANQVNGLFVVTDQTSLDVLLAAIENKPKDDGATCITCAIELADTIADLANDSKAYDRIILDIVTDGVPEIVDTEQDAINAADAVLDIDVINALGVGLDQNGIDFLEDLTDGSGNPGPGQVFTADDFDGFAAAFQDKLFAEVDTPDCNDIPQPDFCVGGEFLPIDSTSLLIAGLSANMSLMVPIVLGIAGASAYIIRSRMNKD